MFEFCDSCYTLRNRNGIQAFMGVIEKLWLKSITVSGVIIQPMSWLCHASQTQPLNLNEKHDEILTWGWNYHNSGTEHLIITLDLCSVKLAGEGVCVGGGGIFTADTRVTDGADKVTNEDTHTWIIRWSL